MQQQQQQLGVGTTFTTKRTRPAVVAVITTLLAYCLSPRPHDFANDRLAHLPVLMILSVPVGHGLSAKKRGMKLREVRAAIMGSGRRYLDEI